LIVIIHYFPNCLIKFFIFIYEFDPNLSEYIYNQNLTEIHLSKVEKITLYGSRT